MRVAYCLFAVIAVVSIVVGVRQFQQYTHHVGEKADRLDAHCALMKIFLDAIDQDIDHGGQSATAATAMFDNLAFNDFRVVRLCTSTQRFDNCSQAPGATCIHRSTDTIRKAWAW